MSGRERFLRELERRLTLRGGRRDDVLAEIASHVEEAVARGEDEDEVVARLGSPREIAADLNELDSSRRLLVLLAAMIFAVAALLASYIALDQTRDSDVISPPYRFEAADRDAMRLVHEQHGIEPYFLGWSFADLPLTNVDVMVRPYVSISFSYGSCETPAWSDLGCAVPLAVQVFRVNDRNPTKWSRRARCFRRRLRGVPVGVLPGNWALNLYTGGSTVTISGERTVVLDAARAVRPVGKTARRTLAPPPSWLSQSLARCDRAPLLEALGE